MTDPFYSFFTLYSFFKIKFDLYTVSGGTDKQSGQWKVRMDKRKT